MVVAMLGMFGFGTREANGGAEGIHLALAEKPDIIICDLRMPEMDGLKTLSNIREHPAIANVPFIFLTGSQDREDFRKGMGYGADDFLTKPFKPEDLVEAITVRMAKREEIKSEIYRNAELLNHKVVTLISAEFSAPIHGILGDTNRLMQDCTGPKKEIFLPTILSINESATRLNTLTRNFCATN